MQMVVQLSENHLEWTRENAHSYQKLIYELMERFIIESSCHLCVSECTITASGPEKHILMISLSLLVLQWQKAEMSPH